VNHSLFGTYPIEIDHDLVEFIELWRNGREESRNRHQSLDGLDRWKPIYEIKLKAKGAFVSESALHIWTAVSRILSGSSQPG
jgi:hypothetical protein